MTRKELKRGYECQGFAGMVCKCMGCAVCLLFGEPESLVALTCSLKVWVDRFEDKERTSGRWAIFSKGGPLGIRTSRDEHVVRKRLDYLLNVTLWQRAGRCIVIESRKWRRLCDNKEGEQASTT